VEPYLFIGTISPERAQLTDQFTVEFRHVSSGASGRAKVSILLNQIAVWVESGSELDIHTLRNIVRNLVGHHLAMLGYVRGFAYDFEVTRVLNSSLGIDYVFGIDIPCISEPRKEIDIRGSLSRLRPKVSGVNGVFIQRCFSDLVSALKYADDTGFYCYRAIESLRHHCAAVHGLSKAGKHTQWKKFRELSECEEGCLRSIKESADPLRHADVFGSISDDRVRLLKETWAVVDRYLERI